MPLDEPSDGAIIPMEEELEERKGKDTSDFTKPKKRANLLMIQMH